MDKKKKSGKYGDMARNMVVVVSLVLILGLVASVTLAQGTPMSFWDNVAEKLSNKLFGGMELPDMGVMFGASGTRFPNGLSADSTSPSAGQIRSTTLLVTNTTTLQEITFGSRYTSSLDFSRGATTTPGGLFSIENTGATKICTRIELDITSGTAQGGPIGTGRGFAFAISTSTTAINGSVSGGAANLMASSTVATSSPGFLNNIDSAGSSGMDSFLWTGGEFINGQFDQVTLSGGGVDNATSSDEYVDMVGNVYITCHTR